MFLDIRSKKGRPLLYGRPVLKIERRRRREYILNRKIAEDIWMPPPPSGTADNGSHSPLLFPEKCLKGFSVLFMLLVYTSNVYVK